MAEANVAPSQMRMIVAGAAKGAWIAVLVGILLAALAYVALMGLSRLHPALLQMLTGMPLEQVWPMLLQWVLAMRLTVYIWLLLATFFSTWWRALK
ncbi:MAG TPA: hypothetical protein VGM19_05305 [Armatimonadota bacterium]|jgi:hypothetical protein